MNKRFNEAANGLPPKNMDATSSCAIFSRSDEVREGRGDGN